MNKRINKNIYMIAGIFAAFNLIVCSVSCSNHLADMESLEQLALLTPQKSGTVTPSNSAATYSITIADCEHGTVSVNKTTAKAGESIVITTAPALGYKRSNITVSKTSDNSSVAVTANSFVMPENNVNISVVFLKQDGRDINAILRNDLGASSTATKFLPSNSAPPGNEIELYSLETGLRVYAWLDGTAIYYYADGHDSNNKIPLVEDCVQLFNHCSSLQKIDMSYFNTANVTRMYFMFNDCKSLSELNISGFNTANVTHMGDMFSGCESLTELNVSSFNTVNVTRMDYMFYRCKNLKKLNLSSFNTANVTHMAVMFSGCESLTELNVSSFNTVNVTYMDGMFKGCKKLIELNLSGFDTSNVTDMSGMFSECTSLTTIAVGNAFDVSNVTKSEIMFYKCISLTGGNGTTYSSRHNGKEYARIDGANGLPGYFTGN